MTANAIPLSESLEDYLETIYLLVQEGMAARSRDIAARMNVAPPSVTGALQALAERELVKYAPYEAITLTARGEKAARRVVQRHHALKDFFVKVLAIDPQEADACACKMEHAVSKNILDRLVGFAEFVEACPLAGKRWLHGFAQQCADRVDAKGGCTDCISCAVDEAKKNVENQKRHGRTMKLNELKPGEKGRIEKVDGQGAVRQRIAAMGIGRGAMVELIRVAPLGDPIDVRIRGYHLSLRKNEAAQIDVQKLDALR